MKICRRAFVRALLGGAGTLGLGGRGAVLAQAAPAGGLAVSALRDGLWRVAGGGGNVVVLDGAEGLALVDSGAPDHEAELLSLLADRFGGAPVEVLFNTHWHLAHTGGNEPFGERGATIIAHENTRLWMSTEFYVDWQDRTYPPRPEAARPTRTFHTSDPQPIELDFGGERILYGYLREAHTDGDIYVRFPDRNVVVAGGAVTVGSYPVMDYITGGWIGGLVESTEKLIALSDAETLIVPRAGAPRSRAYLEAQRDMLETVRERMESMALEGKSAEEMVAAGITDEFDARWGNNRDQFISNAYDGLWWGHRLRGIIA